MDVLGEVLRTFLGVLRSSWPGVKRCLIDSAGWDQSVVYDWAQANWEMIVEAGLSRDGPITLDVYGPGADCNGGSSRVWRPEAEPSHLVVCRPARNCAPADALTGKDVMFPSSGLPLEEFVTMTAEGRYAAMPPVRLCAHGRRWTRRRGQTCRRIVCPACEAPAVALPHEAPPLPPLGGASGCYRLPSRKYNDLAKPSGRADRFELIARQTSGTTKDVTPNEFTWISIKVAE